MKSVFSVIGVLAVVYFLLGSSQVRQSLGNLFNQSAAYEQPGYGQVNFQPPSQSQDVGQAPFPNYGADCGGCDNQVAPVASGPRFEYESSSYAPAYQRVYVQPVYQGVYRYGQYQRVLVTPGYYRQLAAPHQKQKHFAFDFGGFLSAFRR